MKQPKLYQDEQCLRHLYYDLKMLPSEIAKFFNVTPSLIYRYFRKFNIEYNNPRYDEYKYKSNVYT